MNDQIRIKAGDKELEAISDIWAPEKLYEYLCEQIRIVDVHLNDSRYLEKENDDERSGAEYGKAVIKLTITLWQILPEFMSTIEILRDSGNTIFVDPMGDAPLDKEGAQERLQLVEQLRSICEVLIQSARKVVDLYDD